jgi:hypothetical protein
LIEIVIREKVSCALKEMSNTELKNLAARKSRKWPKTLVDAEIKRRKQKPIRKAPIGRAKRGARTEIPSWDDAVGPDPWRLHGM